MVLSKHFGGAPTSSSEPDLRLFHVANARPVATLPNALPSAALSEANKVQPGQPYRRCGRHVRLADQHGGKNSRPRDEPADSFAVRVNF
jgi:hypothetical protein